MQVERLQGVITKLKAENVDYQNDNKTQQFEASIQELQKKLQETGASHYTAVLLESLRPVGTAVSLLFAVE